MLDIKFIRENRDIIAEAARKKHVKFDVKELLKADDERRKLLQEVEEMRAEMNSISESVARLTDTEKKAHVIQETRKFKDKLHVKEELLRKIDEQYDLLMLSVPNIPDHSVPEGISDMENQEIRQWGKKPGFDFEPKNHIELMQKLNLVDFERGVKISGFRGYVLKNDAALVSFALWRYVLDFLVKKGFTPMIAPSLVKEFALVGTAKLPQMRDDIFGADDGLFLSGTAEIPVMSYFKDEVLPEDKLPIKIVAFSPCYRREAGSYGKDLKGIYRMHEFYKVEQVVLCRADHQESVKLHEEITQYSEDIMQSLGLHYRLVVNAGGDLALGQVKMYDIETWVPSEKRFRETHSSSYYHDFQTRRLNIRYKDSGGKSKFVHSLNNTAIATPRFLIPLFEQNQNADGSINIPEVLQPYTGKDKITRS